MTASQRSGHSSPVSGSPRSRRARARVRLVAFAPWHTRFPRSTPRPNRSSTLRWRGATGSRRTGPRTSTRWKLTGGDIYCLDDGPRLLDCLAFDDDLRIGDVLADDVRRSLSGIVQGEHSVVEPGTGPYSPESVDANYRELLRETGLLLAAGNGVVLDESWNRQDHRSAARAFAGDHGAALVEIECSLDAATARARVALRPASGADTSDATPDVVDHLAAHHEPWPEAATICTAESIDHVTARAIASIDHS